MTTLIPEFPTPPSSADPVNFNRRADEYFAIYPVFSAAANAQAKENNALNASSVAAAASAKAASELALASISATRFDPGAQYPEGILVWSPVDGKTYRRKSAGKSALDPSADAANWQRQMLVKSDFGLGNVDNTSDANKPVSTAQQAALDALPSSAHTWSAPQIFDRIGLGGSAALPSVLIRSSVTNLPANTNICGLDINISVDAAQYTANRTHRSAYLRIDGNSTLEQNGSYNYNMIGVEPVARTSTNDGAPGEATELYGVRAYATDNSVRTSQMSMAAGIRASADHTGTTTAKTVASSYGGHFAVSINAATTVRDAHACYGFLSSAGTVTDGYLFRGAYAGGGSYANKWGLHVSGALQNQIDGWLRITDTTASTSPSTGAFRVDGGAGVVGDLRVGGAISAGPVRVGQYTLTTLPSASAFAGYEIDVTNAAGGPKRCRSNGSVWQILNTTTTVS